MAGMKGPQPPEARDRVLSDEEIKAFWQAASAEGWPFSSVFKVLLLTGQRREEVAGMRWREVDLDAGQWTIAKERCKNGKAHAVDLHPEAVRLLDPLSDAAAPRLMKSAEARRGKCSALGFVRSIRPANASQDIYPLFLCIDAPSDAPFAVRVGVSLSTIESLHRHKITAGLRHGDCGLYGFAVVLFKRNHAFTSPVCR